MANESHIYQLSSPAADTEADLYTVPADRVFVGHVHWGNRGQTPATVRVAIRIGGAALDNTHYRIYDKLLTPNESGNTLPLHLNTTDVITIRASTADVTFHCSGLEFKY